MIPGEPALLADPTPADGAPRPRRAGRRRSPLWLRRTAAVALAVFFLGFAYYGITLWQVWSTGNGDQARPVDAIVVMGAANYNCRASALLEARLDHAIALYEEGLAPLVIVTGGKLEGDTCTEAKTSRLYLVDNGLPDDAILSEDSGHSTWQSMVGVADLLAGQELDSVLIVTDPFHALRSRLIAQDLGMTAYTSPTDTSPWGSGTQFKKSMKEAAGIAIGRIIGFERLWRVTG